jgi:hypothetical protein
MLTLHERQVLFLRLLARLVGWCEANGYEVTAGECWRPPFTADEYARRGIGVKDSLHCDRLAIDLNLFKDGVYLTDLGSYVPLGDYWKTLNPLCAWGGEFSKPDPDHFSVAWGGRK